ncbi:MAG: glutathione S-transferase family protein [Pseudomonadota bacterium]
MQNQIQHYYHPMSRAVTTHWMLTELAVEHEQVLIDYTTGGNSTPDFQAINPMQKIPALRDGDVIVTETAAICAYLADKYPDRQMAPPVTSNLRGAYYRYLFFPGTTLEPMFTMRQLGVTDSNPQSTGWGDLDRCLAAIEQMTPAQDWALGMQFTAADVVYGGTLDFAVQFNWLGEPTDKVAAYIRRLKDRPAYRDSHDVDWH